nr:alpha-glucosidase-like [Ipomoea batatas]
MVHSSQGRSQEEEGCSIPKIPINEGSDCVGRSCVPVNDKRLNQKHLKVNATSGGSAKGEAMTTQAARNTSFELLVALSSTGNSSGEVFLVDGEELEMGGAGGRWSLVHFQTTGVGTNVTLTSEVTNPDFAAKSTWIIEKVTVLGMNSNNNSSSNSSGVVEITGLNLPIGNTFTLPLTTQ